LLKNSIIGQLGNFGVSLLKSGLDTFKDNVLKFGGDKAEEDQQHEKMINHCASEGIQFFAENSAHIEVIREKKLEKVYFYYLPYCHALPKDIKNEFNDNVDRVSVQSKVNGLITESERII